MKNLVNLLASIGYEPYISLDDNSQVNTYNNSLILKIGISGFCFANVMMLSLPDYFAGGFIANGMLKNFISILQIGLSLPVLFYTSQEFFIPTYQNLKRGELIIDLPVSIAIIITFFRSIYDIYFGISSGYLDSMTGIVFFMLIGRWMQTRTFDFLNFNRTYKSYFPIAVEKILENNSKITAIEDLKVHDRIKIYNNEIIPIDGILSRGKGWIDYSFVNGECLPVRVEIGEYIYAGGRQLDGVLEVVVMKTHSQSQMTSLWNHYAFISNKKNTTTTWIDKLGIYFTYLVLSLSALAGGYWFYNGSTILGWNTMTTVLIVACPCALLLASSFTFGHFIRVLSQHNFFVRDSSVLDSIQNINHIVWDKTGTLTYTDKQQVSYKGTNLDENTKRDIANILSQSNHVLSKSILNYLNIQLDIEPIQFKEIQGKGIEAWIDEKYYKIGSDEFCGINSLSAVTKVNIVCDSLLLGSFFIQNSYRFGIQNLLKSIQSRYTISILSGDNEAEKIQLKQWINNSSELHFLQSPQDKLNYISQLKKIERKKVMMIGDGLNDAGAFQVSDVAIALTDKNNFFIPSSDVIMSSENISQLDQILIFISKIKWIIRIVFSYSILYNFIGLFFALQGKLSPVLAAILMPISSISIILFVQLMTAYYHNKYLKK